MTDLIRNNDSDREPPRPTPLAGAKQDRPQGDDDWAEGDSRKRAAEDREREADDRERRADARDAAAAERDQRAAERDSEVDIILADADRRDDRADHRDDEADRRDVAAVLDESVFGTSGDVPPFQTRRLAAKDREDSRIDRSAAHIDRFLLTGVDHGTADTDNDAPDG